MLAIAFKEWSAVCRALADGVQTILLRKGGIAEPGGTFRPEHAKFWLYPTHFHEQTQGVRPEFRAFLEPSESDRAPLGHVRFTHFVEVAKVHRITNRDVLPRLAPFHVLSEETAFKRFDYRTAGIYVFLVRTHRTHLPIDIIESPAYAGCKSWVELTEAVKDEPADSVISDADWLRESTRIEEALRD